MNHNPWKCALAILGGAIVGGLAGAEVGGAFREYVLFLIAFGVLGGICSAAAAAC
jgi:hypothetical protein